MVDATDVEEVYDRLLKAIKKHSGMDEGQIRQAGEHGADTGWDGFSYYEDTVKFYEDNESDIWGVLVLEADALGESPLKMVAGFRIADQVTDADTFKNAMSWFALEEIGRYLLEEKD